MTFRSLTRDVSETFGITIRQSEKLVHFVFGEISDELAHPVPRGRVSIPGFGVFTRRVSKARRILNFGGDAIMLPELAGVRFTPGKDLRNLLNPKEALAKAS